MTLATELDDDELSANQKLASRECAFFHYLSLNKHCRILLDTRTSTSFFASRQYTILLVIPIL